MNSPIKLPPLPYPQIPGNDYTAADMRAYAAQAVREALAAQSEWMPIETAPEGTMILCANMNAMEARNWAFVAWMAGGKVCGHRMDQPTHWMPLPAPPKENNHAEGADQ
ncbi:DUF551 domain-containing protein [Achromobacter xylosoxidans]|uniref:DUF551 domain-containing protein n=1 Tax=Alcaligenes xylosoxydans xylosoxydans TaxID=85698 RepID=UPI001EEEE58B|nr:DUF551 domain-containing protein [Achromobacter xylosoxidans]